MYIDYSPTPEYMGLEYLNKTKCFQPYPVSVSQSVSLSVCQSVSLSHAVRQSVSLSVMSVGQQSVIGIPIIDLFKIHSF